MKKFITLLMLSSLSATTFAQVDNSDLSVADESVDSPSIQIEGQYKEAKRKVEAPKVQKLSPSEMLKRRREQLELRNQMMVQKKMEQIRLQQELALAKQLEQSMNKTIEAIDNSMK